MLKLTESEKDMREKHTVLSPDLLGSPSGLPMESKEQSEVIFVQMMTSAGKSDPACKQTVPLRLLNTEKSAPTLLRKRINRLTKFFGAPNLKLYCGGRLLTDEMLANLKANVTIFVSHDTSSGPLLGGAEGGGSGGKPGSGALEDIYV